jgi:putative flippase GtrA
LNNSPALASDRSRLCRYASVGVLALLVHLAVLGVLVELLGVPAGWGSAAGAIAGAQVAFFGNRRFTFSHLGPVWPAWWRFQTTALAGGALGASLVAVATALGLHWLPAQLVATATVLLVTFTINLRWTFGRPRL